MKLIIFALIPLILSIGVAPALQSNFIQDADALKSKGTPSWRYGSATAGIVCGDRLCSEVENENLYVSTQTAVAELEKKELEDDEIELPPYPDLPSIHPKLLATNDYWNPPQVHKVTDGVYSAVGFDIANSIMIEGDDGLIIVDTLSTYEDAKEVIAEFRKITDKPVKAIIYTHGHLDHVHGTGAFLEEGEDIEIYAHESHVDFYINENSVLGPGASLRIVHATGAMLPSEGPDAKKYGRISYLSSWNNCLCSSNSNIL